MRTWAPRRLTAGGGGRILPDLPMSEKFILNTAVRYGDVDREELLSLPGFFKILQEAAIAHANQFDTGTHAMLTRGESWMMNRLAVAIHRYPRYEEPVRVETWSSGIKGFKGYREFRVHDGHGDLLLAGSSLWLYVSLRTKSIVRVPREVAAGFPMDASEQFCAELESLEFAAPSAAARSVTITLRYADIDANAHVNHTAYLDFVQTALARAGVPPRPGGVRIKYLKGIPAEAEAVNVRVAPRAQGAGFSIECDETVCALGEVL